MQETTLAMSVAGYALRTLCKGKPPETGGFPAHKIGNWCSSYSVIIACFHWIPLTKGQQCGKRTWGFTHAILFIHDKIEAHKIEQSLSTDGRRAGHQDLTTVQAELRLHLGEHQLVGKTPELRHRGSETVMVLSIKNTVKPVYNDHLMRHFSAFWSSSRWPRAT